MSFDSNIRADLDAIIADVFGETIRYKPHGGAWGSMSAAVEDDADEIGLPVHGRTEAIVVTVSKTDVASVERQKDVIERGGKEYTVHKVITQDAAGWRLYGVR